MSAYISRRAFLKKCSLGAIGAAIPKLSVVYAAPPFDKVIKDATILDGTGRKPWKGDVGITGDKIALSGNTGYSNIPHLHFIVYSPQDSTKWKSYPVTFITREGIVSEPVVRKMYTAQ